MPIFVGSWKAREFQTNLSFFFIDYVKTFDYIDYSKLWKIGVGIPDHLICLLRNLMQVKKQQLELDMEQWPGLKLGKEYIKAAYCYPASLIYKKSTS